MGTAIKHPVPDRVKPSFVIIDIQTLCRSGLKVRVPGCQKLQMTDDLIRSGTTVGVKWLTYVFSISVGSFDNFLVYHTGCVTS